MKIVGLVAILEVINSTKFQLSSFKDFTTFFLLMKNNAQRVPLQLKNFQEQFKVDYSKWDEISF